MTEQFNLFDHPPAFVGLVSKHPAYRAWSCMLTRCHNPNDNSFPDYGGRGIFVCDDWRISSRAFVAWAIRSGYRPGLQIDRLNNDGPYAPDNCRWVTRRVNNLNRRDTVRLSDGSPLAVHISSASACYRTVKSRVRSGLSPDRALAARLRGRRHFLNDGTPLGEAARLSGLPRATVYYRIAQGWSPDDAVSVPKGGKRPAPAQKKPDGFAVSAAELPPSGGVVPVTPSDAEKHTVSPQGRQP